MLHGIMLRPQMLNRAQLHARHVVVLSRNGVTCLLHFASNLAPGERHAHGRTLNKYRFPQPSVEKKKKRNLDASGQG